MDEVHPLNVILMATICLTKLGMWKWLFISAIDSGLERVTRGR